MGVMFLIESGILFHIKVPLYLKDCLVNFKAVAILPSTAIYPQRLFCRELFVIGQS